MKKIIALILACVSIQAHAIVVQTVRLKNGSELNGYIQQQDRNDNITFKSDNATIVVDGVNVVSSSETSYKPFQIDQKWRDWAIRNDGYNVNGKDTTIILSDIRFGRSVDAGGKQDNNWLLDNFNGGNINGVKILEKGSKVKYLDMTQRDYRFNWSDVESITAAKRPKTMLSGIDRTYTLKDGKTYTGQYAGEGNNTLSLYGKDGMIQTFDIDDVVMYEYKGINPDQTLFEQSELLDIVVKNDNNRYEGVITQRDFREGNEYLVLQRRDNSIVTVKLGDIKEFIREENKDRNLIEDVILKDGEYKINRLAADTVGTSKVGTYIVLDTLLQTTVIKSTGGNARVYLEYNNTDRLPTNNITLVKLKSIVIEENKKKKSEESEPSRYGFSADIFEMSKINPVSEATSVNGTTRLDYDIPSTGAYAFYDSSIHKAMPFIVKE